MAKRIDPELKEGIQEVVKAVDALTESEFPESMAQLMKKMKEELVSVGFTHDEAFQLLVAHGVQNQINR